MTQKFFHFLRVNLPARLSIGLLAGLLVFGLSGCRRHNSPSGSVHEHELEHAEVHKHTESCESAGVHEHEHAESCKSAGVHEHEHAESCKSAGVHEHEHAESRESAGVHEHEHAESCKSAGVHDHGPCEGHNHEALKNHINAGHTHADGNAIIFTDAQAALIDFAVENVRAEKVGQVITAVAQVQPAPGSECDIIAKAGGIVSFGHDGISLGREVAKGEKLFFIECGGMMENSMHQYYTETVNAYEQTKAEYERKKALAQDKVISASALLQAKTEYENALAKYTHLRENFSSDKQTVTSPMAGYIKQIDVKNGQFVEAGQELLTVSQNKRVRLQADLPVRYYSLLKNITDVNLREMNESHAHSLEELHGRLVSYGQSTQSGNPLIPVIFEIDNVLEVVPGSFVNLYLKTGGDQERLSVPNTALIEEMGNFFVMVRCEPEVYDKRPVRIGGTDGFRTEILGGVREGETVVSRGAAIVKLAQGSAAIDPHAGHHH